jgi:hypothetical protein
MIREGQKERRRTNIGKNYKAHEQFWAPEVKKDNQLPIMEIELQLIKRLIANGRLQDG